MAERIDAVTGANAKLASACDDTIGSSLSDIASVLSYDRDRDPTQDLDRQGRIVRMRRIWTAVLAAGMLLVMSVGLAVAQDDTTGEDTGPVCFGSDACDPTHGDAGCTEVPCFPRDPYVGNYAKQNCGMSPEDCCDYLDEGSDEYNRCTASCKHFTPYQNAAQTPVWVCNLEPIETDPDPVDDAPMPHEDTCDNCSNPLNQDDSQPSDETQPHVDTELDVLVATIVAIILGILAGAGGSSV